MILSSTLTTNLVLTARLEIQTKQIPPDCLNTCDGQCCLWSTRPVWRSVWRAACLRPQALHNRNNITHIWVTPACGELGTLQLVHRRQTSFHDPGPGQTLRTERPLVGGLSFHEVSEEVHESPGTKAARWDSSRECVRHRSRCRPGLLFSGLATYL